MESDVTCSKCGSTYAYQDGAMWICPECGHEWSQQDQTAEGSAEGAAEIRDANGNVLADGDTVTVIKDLKVKGSSLVVKGGTKVKGIRLTDGGDGHDIACKIPGIGAMNLKSEFVKKA
ncbi:zinc ribbon domain-containing protein YjdM [Acetobacter farinalis]|uniref:Zinc ribbon domain-containing protein YjdM n=1 Tax=Acetobacter farinalis TaxID=1260984 RepID=A0ABT3Q702_9PROT|nr:zinc ribbon domain-containing protein YjdM [Acetobacter farinalis]MCX2561016.1 zinc ribbon domain-containing protein YjdM [Acetobacter farinalis]NHO29734.1 alkylphosphonate utilization protein [Acetobacter farinalis]